MKREDLLKSKEYWITKIQLDLFEMIENYLKVNNLSKKQLADKLGVSKSYITQILNGNFDHKISKLVELSLAFEKVPLLEYKNISNYITNETLEVQKEVNKKVIIELNFNASPIIKKEPKDSYTNINNISKILLYPQDSLNSDSLVLHKC